MMRKIHNGGGKSVPDAEDTNPRAGEALVRPVHRIRGGRRTLLTAYPEKEMTAWPVRPKFNYGDLLRRSEIIEPVAEMQTLGL